jgi:ribosomal protein L37AE/L43A
MIINCPHCGKQVRVLDEGAYRCPLCLNIFEFHPEQPTAPAPGEDASPLSEYQPPDEETMPPRTESGEPPATEEAPVEEPSEGPAEDASIEEPSRETPALPFPTWETAQEPFVAEEPSAGADVCEVCRRRPAKHVCHETGLLLCDDCAVTDAQGRPLWRDRQPVSPPLESSRWR